MQPPTHTHNRALYWYARIKFRISISQRCISVMSIFFCCSLYFRFVCIRHAVLLLCADSHLKHCVCIATHRITRVYGSLLSSSYHTYLSRIHNFFFSQWYIQQQQPLKKTACVLNGRRSLFIYGLLACVFFCSSRLAIFNICIHVRAIQLMPQQRIGAFELASVYQLCCNIIYDVKAHSCSTSMMMKEMKDIWVERWGWPCCLMVADWNA